MPSGPSPQCRFRRASVPCGRRVVFSVRPCRRRIGSDGGHLEWGGGGPPARGGSRIMRDAPIEAIAVGRGVSGMWGMRETPRPRRRAPMARHACRGSANGPGGPVHPPQVPAVIRRASVGPFPGRPRRPRCRRSIPRAPRFRGGRGAIGFVTAGTWQVGAAFMPCRSSRASTAPRGTHRTPLRCPPLSAPGSKPGRGFASTPARHGCPAEPALRQRPARHPCLA